jgi:quinoprotein glucose dehydrogenase
MAILAPPAIYKNLVITGNSLRDNYSADSPDGIVRAFNAVTGKLVWQFDPIPKALRNKTGAANTWAKLSVDQKHGIVYLATSSPSPDYYGGLRNKPMPYTDALVALNANTGKVIWSYQLIHHNLWDYDLPAQPSLVTLHVHGKAIPAVVETTKMGMIFSFNRLTGKPIFPIVERKVPQSTLAGETTAKTQPFPTVPKPLIQQTFTARNAWGAVYFDKKSCMKKMAHLKNQGIYTPPSIQGSLQVPGAIGGSEWGGGVFNPQTENYIVNMNNMAWVDYLIPRKNYDKERKKFGKGIEEFGPQKGVPYGMARFPLLSNLGAPCSPTPWGKLISVNLVTGKVNWQRPIGFKPLLGPIHSFKSWGSPTIGGGLLTKPGLLFISSTLDGYFRAISTKTGKTIWKEKLPAPGIATPMTYRWHGKQYIVIAAGGSALMKTPLSDAVVAYALPSIKRLINRVK